MKPLFIIAILILLLTGCSHNQEVEDIMGRKYNTKVDTSKVSDMTAWFEECKPLVYEEIAKDGLDESTELILREDECETLEDGTVWLFVQADNTVYLVEYKPEDKSVTLSYVQTITTMEGDE